MPANYGLTFPNKHGLVTADWAPLLVRPIAGSPETLVAAVAAANGQGFHLEPANALVRLQCLYAVNAKAVEFAIQASIEMWQSAIAQRGIAALGDPPAMFTGVSIGEIRRGENTSVQEIARSWLAALSSLHDPSKLSKAPALILDAQMMAVQPRPKDRLPRLVFDAMEERNSNLASNFRDDIREMGQKLKRRAKLRAYDVIVDYNSNVQSVNFVTLKSAGAKTSIDAVKRGMHDLRLSRDGAANDDKPYRLVLQRPAPNDPQFTEQRLAQIAEAVEELKAQTIGEGLQFSDHAQVEEIAVELERKEMPLVA